jgi:hypothetical protein
MSGYQQALAMRHESHERQSVVGTYREEIQALDASYQATSNELGRQRGDIATSEGAARNAFIQDTWTPLLTSWRKYRDAHDSWYEAPWGGATIRTFIARLKEFRERAKAAGFDFAGPDPHEPAGGTLEKFAASLGGIIKYLLIGGIIIVVFLVVSKIVGGARVQRTAWRA